MDAGILASTHISSLSPTQPTVIHLQTVRNDTPLPAATQDTDQLPEHAIYSSVLNSPNTGTLVLRVIHGGLIVELLSLSTDVPSLRLVFPAAVLSTPALFTWGANELFLLAVTCAGSFYRLVIPIGNGRRLWKEDSGNIWTREYLVKIPATELIGPVHVQGIHCAAIGLARGALLRIESEVLGHDGQQDEWVETVFHHSSFFSSWTSLLPIQGGNDQNASEIVSLASVPWPTDIGHIWSLSRDRTLRLWKAKIGCVSTRVLASTVSGREPAPKQQLLDSVQQNLLRVFGPSSNNDQLYVLAFLPTISSSTSGGIFRLTTTVADHLHDLGAIESSSNSAHCRLQDFIVIDNLLYTLWDRQGQTLIERTVINVETFCDQDHHTWHAVHAYPEPEHTPGYLEKLLLSPGSIAEKGLEVILRPGAFSVNTLRTAIDEYTDACLTLPGVVAPQLTVSYGSLAENIASVVGCTVKLVYDPQTGVPQYSAYWTSMKRDWEGFISRCARLERLGSRPLALGVDDQGNVIVAERERIRMLVREDLALYIRRVLAQENHSIESQYDILTSSWMLSSTLNPQFVANLETRLNDLFQQGINFSLSDIIQDLASRSKMLEHVDEGTANWVVGRLQRIDDLDAATKAALDVIGGLDMEIKREEDEVELLLPSTNSHWLRATTAAYITATVDARYDLSLSLVILLLFLANDLTEWDPSLLAEVLAVFRGVAMLRLASRQMAIDDSKTNDSGTSSDDVVAKMRNMHVSLHKVQTMLNHSLIHALLAQSDPGLGLPGAAHRFLDSSGLLQSISPANGTKYELIFCERLRLLNYSNLSRELLSWLPKTSGVIYVQARLWVDLGRFTDASDLFQRLAGSFVGVESGISAEDQEALTAILPTTEHLDSAFKFYVHVATLFKHQGLVRSEVVFARLAITAAPDHTDTSPLWLSVIKGYIDLGIYDNAYSFLMSMPYEKQKRECVSQLAYKMCEDSALKELLTFNFAGILDEVEDALSFKARNVDPRVRPYYSKILHAWYTSRGDHRNAALAMYDRARRIHDLIADVQSFLALAEEQQQAYAVALNSLSLVDQADAWFVLPSSTQSNTEARKRRKITRHIPEAKYGSGRFEAEVIQLADIQYDYAALSAHIDLVRTDPTSLSSEDLFLPVSIIILKLAQANRLNQAISHARNLKIDMTDLFTYLARECLRLSKKPDTLIQEDSFPWLFEGKTSTWSGSPAERCWKYLRHVLEIHDSADTDYRYTKAVAETIFAHDRRRPLPPWVVSTLDDFDPEFLIRTSLRYEKHADAIEYSLSLIRKCNAKLTRDPPRNASTTWLPYTLIDQVLATSKSLERLPTHLSALEKELSDYVRRIQKMADSRSL
ncbi:hypothetical protein M378DRAFT_72126 [Amanita muscaria Koide BX008]|uniref:Nuclear pore complex protein Nup160 n=1 Tax=Amanita muscaria (strain Koide BX008) TaxID=946122 RepID=A0A0C2XFH6_AMAMK|nr:hypothetical protein M378DRAFT_72126 [Amanita muscaria Koide BX008]